MKPTAFEVKLYHRRESQADAAERWAGLTSRVVHANDAAEARRMALRDYPPEQGFVVSSVAAVTLQ